MTTGYTIAEETRLAEEIVSVLPAGSVARLISDERDSIRFAVQNGALKLRTIVFSRASLARLANDPARTVKIEYLKRDLSQTATRRCEFRYPAREREHQCNPWSAAHARRPSCARDGLRYFRIEGQAKRRPSKRW